MSGRESAGPLRACVKLADCCDPSSTGTLTCVTSLETCIESDFCHRIRTIRNSGSFSFVLVRMVRLCVCISSSCLIE
jgi:hypothetical protein